MRVKAFLFACGDLVCPSIRQPEVADPATNHTRKTQHSDSTRRGDNKLNKTWRRRRGRKAELPSDLLVELRRANNGDGLWEHHLIGTVRVKVHAGQEGRLCGMSLEEKVQKALDLLDNVQSQTDVKHNVQHKHTES